MKFICFLFLLLSSFFFEALAQNSYIQSTLLGYSQGSRCQLYLDDAGNAYAIINSRDDINFHGKVFPRHGAADYSVIGKFDSSGRLLWSRTISNNTNPAKFPTDIIYHLTVDADENIYISGAGGDITLDDGKVLAGGTFLIKFNGKGQTLWGLISENTQNTTTTIGGPVALAKDGVYWSSIFYSRLELQGRVLNTNNPNGGTPNAFVAKVNSAGQVTSIYHDQSVGSIPQLMVSAENGNASVIISRGGMPKYRVILDENCHQVSDSPFITYGDFPMPLRKHNGGYEMFTHLFDRNANGWYDIGFYDIKFDSNLKITDSVKFLPDKINNRTVYDAISDNGDGFYFNSPKVPFSQEFDWIFMSKDFNQTILKPEAGNFSSTDPFTRSFTKMYADTLNMLMRHLDYYTTEFVFNQQSYKTQSNLDMSYFWTKYVYQDPDSCKKVQVKLVQNGKEGLQHVKIKFLLPGGCPASEDIGIQLTLKDPQTNDGDIVLPPNVIIKKGYTETLLTIPVLNDNYIESLEEFTLNLTLNPTAAGYLIPASTVFKIEDDDNTPANKVFAVTYTPEITEGGSIGKINVSLPENVWLKQELRFSFVKEATAHGAAVNDYKPFEIIIPPNTNKVAIDVKAIADNLIEGDEYILGRIVENGSVFGPFTSTDNLVKIKIIDVDNTEANRVIEIVTLSDKVLENSKTDVFFKLKAPYRLQDPINFSVNPTTWFPFLQQTDVQVRIDSLGANKHVTITYLDDHVIRTDKQLALSFSGASSYPGTFKFQNSSGIITDKLELTAVDNDIAQAKLLLQPVALEIKEGNTANVTIKLPDDYVMETNTLINYEWRGLEITEDKRLGATTNTITLPAMKNSLQTPVKILDDNIINQYNTRQIAYSARNNEFGDLLFTTSDIVDVNIADDEIGMITVPNAFTPNGDGINDTWEIKGLINGANVNISIWNRSGALIHQQTQYSPWNGTYNGSLAQPGVYYYSITLKGKTIAAGSLAIVR
ncbi:gliding motility-associated C-terminal domain-containing protein [Mucilaginibacter auburnensis]|uniref:Gliding motility-associated-like protein n=1 Tax=Mucilaginibacter auburnensis TaxID=1457233 RepID=A0A2H9VRT3_9SPHI|nr:gliding motility-associated C-terminal domain-containing protein [Mucilaginibacter auburnensis]PJJ83521.1 gliding motility-associated-like protein [Mucilaginibacter auburnensis]